MIIGAFFLFIMAAAIAGTAIAIYPILKTHNEALALGVVGGRIVEGVFVVNPKNWTPGLGGMSVV